MGGIVLVCRRLDDMDTPHATAPNQLSIQAIWGKMLRHFPHVNADPAHRTRDYFIAAFTFFCVSISAIFEIGGSVGVQQVLGAIAWIVLIGLMLGENRETKAQVAIAVIFARGVNILAG